MDLDFGLEPFWSDPDPDPEFSLQNQILFQIRIRIRFEVKRSDSEPDSVWRQKVWLWTESDLVWSQKVRSRYGHGILITKLDPVLDQHPDLDLHPDLVWSQKVKSGFSLKSEGWIQIWFKMDWISNTVPARLASTYTFFFILEIWTFWVWWYMKQFSNV